MVLVILKLRRCCGCNGGLCGTSGQKNPNNVCRACTAPTHTSSSAGNNNNHGLQSPGSLDDCLIVSVLDSEECFQLYIGLINRVQVSTGKIWEDSGSRLQLMHKHAPQSFRAKAHPQDIKAENRQPRSLYVNLFQAQFISLSTCMHSLVLALFSDGVPSHQSCHTY